MPFPFVVTLLGESLPQKAVDEVLHALHAYGLTGGSITRLDEPLPGPGGPDHFSALELAFKLPDQPNLWDLKKALAQLSLSHRIDIAFQKDAPHRRKRRLVAFDMDSTLIQAEVIDEFAREMGVYEEVARITEEAMRGNLNFEGSLARRVALLQGLTQDQIEAVYARIQLTSGAEELLKALKNMGCKTALLSGGFMEVASRIQTRLGIDEVYANRLEMREGVCTGRTLTPIIDAQAKARLLEEIAFKYGIELDETIAVGDGANDLLMLAKSGLGVAFNAKPIVAEQAAFALKGKPLTAILHLMGLTTTQIRKLVG